MLITEIQITEAVRAKAIENLSAAASMIAEAVEELAGIGAIPLIIPLIQSGKTVASIAEAFIAAKPSKKPKEKTMATATKKKPAAKKASKPMEKALKAVKAMKPAKKAAKKVAK